MILEKIQAAGQYYWRKPPKFKDRLLKRMIRGLEAERIGFFAVQPLDVPSPDLAFCATE
jgi:hypothetical protein